MLKRLFMIIILVLINLTIFVKCIRNKDNITGYLNDTETGYTEEYYIYSTILNSFQNYQNPVFVLRDSTVRYRISKDSDYINENLPDLQDETIEDYNTINQQNIKLKKIAGLVVTCYLIEYERRSEWKELYPDADSINKFSQVGFNSSKDQALVYYDSISAPLCGIGLLYLLEKDNSGWVIVNELMIWLS